MNMNINASACSLALLLLFALCAQTFSAPGQLLSVVVVGDESEMEKGERSLLLLAQDGVGPEEEGSRGAPLTPPPN